MAASLQPLAGIGVTYAGREKACGERQHDEIKHEMLLCMAGPTGGLALSMAEVPPGAYDFEAGARAIL
jgi:hypothetical protein